LTEEEPNRMSEVDVSGAAQPPRPVESEPPHRPRLRQVPPLTRRQWRVFGISTTAGFFDAYDLALLSLALKQIQHGLGIAEAHLGNMLSAIRLGYLTSLLISPLADVFGRAGSCSIRSSATRSSQRSAPSHRMSEPSSARSSWRAAFQAPRRPSRS
jgi:hypothetical protein